MAHHDRGRVLTLKTEGKGWLEVELRPITTEGESQFVIVKDKGPRIATEVERRASV